MSEPNKKGDGLGDLSRDNIKKPSQHMTQEEAAKAMAEFYSTMVNGMINLVAIMAAMQKSMSEIAIDTNDIAFYLKKSALKDGAVTEMDIEEHEKEEDEPPPENSSAP